MVVLILGYALIFSSSCPFWIRICQLIFFFQKNPDFVEVKIDISRVILKPFSSATTFFMVSTLGNQN